MFGTRGWGFGIWDVTRAFRIPNPGSRIPTRLASNLLVSLVIANLATAGCVPGPLKLPGGPGTPRSDFAALFDQATRACRGVRTLTAELSVSGRAGGQRLRGRVQAGLGAPGAVRLEAPAPLGAPLFILAAPSERGTLLLPRDRRVLYNASVRDMLGALVGIELGAADLRALLSGCVLPDPHPQAGREYPRGWVAIELPDGAVVWLRQAGGRWSVAAGDHAGVLVDYGQHGSAGADTPRELRVSAGAGSTAKGLDLKVSLAQVEINVPLGTEVFAVTVSPETTPITLDELRARGPLSRP